MFAIPLIGFFIQLLYNRWKGHGNCCIAALCGMHRFFAVCIVYHRPPPCVVIKHKPCTINGGTYTKTVPSSKIKSQCAGTTPNTLISANRPKSILTSLNFVKNLITSTQYEPLTSSWFYIVTCDLIITNTKLVGCHLNNIDCEIEYTAD